MGRRQGAMKERQKASLSGVEPDRKSSRAINRTGMEATRRERKRQIEHFNNTYIECCIHNWVTS
jgi:hypothetical protein